MTSPTHKHPPPPNRAVRLTFLPMAGLLAIALVVACGGGSATEVVPTATSTPVPTGTLGPVQTPTEATTPPPDPLAEKVWDTAVMLAEELSPRESATDEELRAAEYLAGRFSGWGYEVGDAGLRGGGDQPSHPAGGHGAGGCGGGD